MKKNYSTIINKIENEIKNTPSKFIIPSISISLAKKHIEENNQLNLDLIDAETKLQEKTKYLNSLNDLNNRLNERKNEVVKINDSNSTYLELLKKIETDEEEIKNLNQKLQDLEIKLDIKERIISKKSKDKQNRINLVNEIINLEEVLNETIKENQTIEGELATIDKDYENANSLFPKIEKLEENEAIAISKIDSIWNLLNDDNFDKSLGRKK